MKNWTFWAPALVNAAVGLALAACETQPKAGLQQTEKTPRTFTLTAQAIRQGLERHGGFPSHLLRPSPVLQDFFGVLAAPPGLSESRLAKTLASMGFAQSDDGFEFREPGGLYRVSYFDQSPLTVELPDRAASDTESFYVITADSEEIDATVGANAFVERVTEAGYSDHLLRQNRQFETEKRAEKERNNPSLPTAECAARTEDFFVDSTSNSLLLFGDEPHGNSATTGAVMQLMTGNTLAFDWFAIEMIPKSMQSLLDTIAAAPEFDEQSPASKALELYFNTTFAWQRHPKPWPGNENPYWTVVKTAMRLGKPVYALDVDPADQFFRGAGEIPISFFARNFVWAEALPERGKGIIFGGPAHFDFRKLGLATGFNVQDAYLARNQDAAVYCAFLRNGL